MGSPFFLRVRLSVRFFCGGPGIEAFHSTWCTSQVRAPRRRPSIEPGSFVPVFQLTILGDKTPLRFSWRSSKTPCFQASPPFARVARGGVLSKCVAICRDKPDLRRLGWVLESSTTPRCHQSGARCRTRSQLEPFGGAVPQRKIATCDFLEPPGLCTGAGGASGGFPTPSRVVLDRSNSPAQSLPCCCVSEKKRRIWSSSFLPPKAAPTYPSGGPFLYFDDGESLVVE